MATNAIAKTDKPAKKIVSFIDRTKNQLNVQALKGKITAAELADLQSHITKIQSLIS